MISSPNLVIWFCSTLPAETVLQICVKLVFRKELTIWFWIFISRNPSLHCWACCNIVSSEEWKKVQCLHLNRHFEGSLMHSLCWYTKQKHPIFIANAQYLISGTCDASDFVKSMKRCHDSQCSTSPFQCVFLQVMAELRTLSSKKFRKF